MTFLERARALVSQMTLPEKISQMCYNAPAIERLGIPAYNWWNECLHGVARSGVATVFPQAIGMAASFDTELVHEVAEAISDEARAKYNEYRRFGSTDIYQGLTYWSPNINIFRDPRWGRGQETYGEDPTLTGKMGVAFIRGLQGEGKHRKLDATVKHYAVHSGPEADRHHFNATVSERDLHETYLAAFRYCIEHADPSAVMGAYNRVNGEVCCAAPHLLGDLLYGELGFRGYVVSDCGAIDDLHLHHKVTANAAESAAAAVKNGCQLNCGRTYIWLMQAYELGLIDEETVTAAVERLFEARFRLGMFDEDCEYNAIPYEIVDCDAHRALNRKMAASSIVLLKNDGILPLSGNETVAVIGPNAASESILLGNYNGTPSRTSTLLRGLQAAAKRVIYAEGSPLYKRSNPDYGEQHLREALIAAKRADVVVLCLGIDPSMEGEETDGYNSGFTGDRPDIELPEVQRELLSAIASLGKPTVCVSVSGSCLNLAEADARCNAVLQCFYPGAEGGDALADVLFGRVSPSARLPVTFYRTVDDLPDFSDYSMENRTYKFYRGTPVYPFGHGLTYADIREVWLDGKTCEITSLGGMETDYTVLQYEYLPHKSLKDFRKIHILPGETKRVCFP